MRKHLTYANVAATLALVFSMSGGALAAKHYLINSTKQISPKVLKKLKTPGKPGATGKEGPAGKNGSNGLEGKQGPRGASDLVPLESGQTITGIVGGRFENGATAGNPVGAIASFPIHAPVVIDNAHTQTAPTANCTGSATNPTAARGFVCVYPSVLVNAESPEANPGVGGGDVWGFMLDWIATKANEQSSVRATYAYTAP